MTNIRNERVIKTLGENLRELRLERELSQLELANLADMMVSQVSRIERGATNATVITICALAFALKVDLNTLIPRSAFNLPD